MKILSLFFNRILNIVKLMENLSFTLPILTVSELNKKEHWTVSSKRHKNQQRSIRVLLGGQNFPIPCKVKLIRLGGRILDDDNLRGAFKWIRDELSDIILGNAYDKDHNRIRGRHDGDPRISWDYGQDSGVFKGIRIDVEPR